MTEKEISKDDFYLDLLFYYRHLNCLVVFELLEQDMPDLERSKHKLALA